MIDPTKSRVQATRHGKKILVVDDNPDAAELVSQLLVRQGHDVRSAHRPSEAIVLAAEFQPDIAFIDIELPVMDGFELMARLRALPELRDCRFIAISGYDDADDRKRSRRLGFEAHLIKPISMETLEQLVLGASAPSRQRPTASL